MPLSLPDIDPAKITSLAEAKTAIRLLMNSFENLIQAYVQSQLELNVVDWAVRTRYIF